MDYYGTMSYLLFNSCLQSPRSPSSPRSEVVHPEWANQNRPSRGRQGSKRSGYSMTGVSEELGNNVEYGNL